MDGCAAMADRGPAAARDSRGNAEQTWLQAARPGRRPGQAGDLRRDLGQDVQVRREEGRLEGRPLRRDQGRVRKTGSDTLASALRFRPQELRSPRMSRLAELLAAF